MYAYAKQVEDTVGARFHMPLLRVFWWGVYVLTTTVVEFNVVPVC